MSINLTVPKAQGPLELKPRITVVGVGGAGGNAINNMIKRELGGVDFIATNTDAQSLAQSKAEHCIQLGANLTQGLGAGAKPEIGRAAAEEAIEQVLGELDNVHMTFIAAGMGGGTGTGAAPVIARAAREAGILTVGVVTKPFQFEGSHRMALAEEGIAELEKVVDTLIIIPNQNLFRVANESTTFSDAFSMADQVLYSGVRGVTDLIVMHGFINLDFADIRSVMSEMGKAMMGTGEAEGERRALDAAEAAINNPLLDDTSMKGAKGVLINITGSDDITLFEVDEAASRIRSEIDDDARIIVGSAFDTEMQGKMRVSVVATGIDSESLEIFETKTLDFPEKMNDVSRPETLLAQNVNKLDDDQESNIESKSDHVESILSENIQTEISKDKEEAIDFIDDSLASRSSVEGSYPSEEGEENFFKRNTGAISDSMSNSQENLLSAFIPPKPTKPDLDADIGEVSFPNALEIEEKRSKLEGEEKIKEIDLVRPSLFELVTRTGKAAIGLSKGAEPKKINPILSNKEEDKVEKSVRDFDLNHSTAIEPKNLGESPEVAEPQAESELLPLKSLDEVSLEETRKDLNQETNHVPNLELNQEQDDLLDIPAFLRRQAN